MQTLDDQILFKRLLEMNVIEKQVLEAFDKLTDSEIRDFNEKKHLRSLIEEATNKIIQDANDKIGFCISKLNQLEDLRTSDSTDEMKVKAFDFIMDEYTNKKKWSL
jgi:hypothetical protein